MKKCFRCKKKATQQWDICADGNKGRWICIDCDIKLNQLVLKFMGFKNWKKMIRKYKDEK